MANTGRFLQWHCSLERKTPVYTQLEDIIVKATKEEVKWDRGVSILSSMKICTESLF